MTNTDAHAKLKSKLRALKFYDQLETVLKRHRPSRYAPFAAKILQGALTDRSKLPTWPPHFILQSIEANCAYHRSQNDDPVDIRRLERVKNIYVQYYDPYLEYVLKHERDFILFFLALDRQQMDLMMVYGPDDLARCFLLFLKDDPMPQSRSAFRAKHGLSMNEWIYMCLAINAYLSTQEFPLTRPSNYLDSEIKNLPKTAVEPFFRLSGITATQLGQQYRAARAKLEPHLHILIPSNFLRKPMVEVLDGLFVVPHAELMLRLAWDGIYRLCLDWQPTFGRELGKSFQRYVGLLLANELPDANVLHEEEIAGNVLEGRPCDYAVELEDCILLIECKATSYSADLLVETAIKGDNSTGKLAESFEQLHSTASRIRAGDLDGCLSDSTQPIVAVAVTYGDIPFANSEWYWETAIRPRVDLDAARHGSFPSPLASRPQVMQIRTFERFLLALRFEKVSAIELVTRKLQQPYESAGDWREYLNNLLRAYERPEISLLRATADEIYEDIKQGLR